MKAFVDELVDTRTPKWVSLSIEERTLIAEYTNERWPDFNLNLVGYDWLVNGHGNA
jgi:hypothetical protein